MRNIFISDLHLSIYQPKLIENFLYFLKKEIYYTDSLYILGDLFDLWIGDDNAQSLYKLIAKSLFELKKKNIKCFLIKGNRDLFISTSFAKLSGLIFLPEEIIIDIYGKKILILHGDTLCTNNYKYKFFRKNIDKIWIKKIFFSLPLFIRKKIEFYMQSNNKKFNLIKKEDIKKNIINICINYKISWIIHGHLHNNLFQNIKFDHNILKHIILCNWTNKNGSMIIIDKKKISLIKIIF